MSKKAKKHWMKNVAGALVIPVFAAVLLQGICMANGRTMIVNMVSFDNFMGLYGDRHDYNDRIVCEFK